MKKYFVLVENVKRKNGERGYCDPIIKEQFDDENAAHEYYNDVQIENFLYKAETTDHYVEKSLVMVEYEDGKDIGNLHEFVETKTYGEEL